MDEAERGLAIRRLVRGWGVALVAALVLFGAWRLFLLFCPTRDWPVLGWSLGRADAQTWNQPQIPALVAENALENGGSIGEALGRALYDRTLAPAADSPVPGGAPAYASLHLPYAWLGASGVQWSTQPWVPADGGASDGAVLVHVAVQVRLGEPVSFGSCTQTEALPAEVARDYVVVPTPLGWRVAYVYQRNPGTPLAGGVGLGSGTAAALLEGCG